MNFTITCLGCSKAKIMAQTHFNLDKEYLTNHYRFKPMRDGYLLTNDFGSWVHLNKNEFELFRHNQLNQNQALLSLLKDKEFVIAENNINKLVRDFRQRSVSLFRGTYRHVIFLDSGISGIENIKKIADFILQTLSMEIIIKFKGDILNNFKIIKNFVAEFKNNSGKKIAFEIETDLSWFNKELVEFLIDNRFDVWVLLKNINLSEEAFNFIKELQRRHTIKFFMDVSNEILGEEQRIIDFFVKNNFKSFFVRKTEDVNKDDFVDFWKNAIEKIYDINKKSGRIVIQELYTNILLKKMTNIDDVFYPELNDMCTGAVASELGYDLKGGVYANEESIGIELFNVGNVNSNYSSVVLSDDALALRSTSINGNVSVEMNPYKPYIGVCPVCNYLETENIIGRYPSQRALILSEMLDYLFEKLLSEEEFLRFV